MVQFLNTDGLKNWIPKLIEESKKELVIVVPYIKTSELMYQKLLEANERGVETVIVYREESLSKEEKRKLTAISNLNLLNHPNIHAKCYLNQERLIITSMNMYEYSEKNNREMGVLLKNDGFGYDRNSELFEDAIIEIKEIINGSTMDKPSIETKELGFELDLIKTNFELAEDRCKELSKAFIHKRFKPELIYNRYYPVCTNFRDKMKLILDSNVEFELGFDKSDIYQIHKRFKKTVYSQNFEGFRLYWKQTSKNPRIYIHSDVYERENFDLQLKSIVDTVAEYLLSLK